MFNNKFTKHDPVADSILKILESSWDDDDDDVKRADAELRRMKAKPIEADKKTDPDKEMSKLAKKEPKEIDESWDDDEDDDVARADRELKRMKAKPIEADKKTDPDKEISKLAKKTPKEIDESLKGSQHKLDVAKPKGKLTAADFEKLRKEESESVSEDFSDVVKGIKRKIAGKTDPKEVQHMYGRIARSAIKNKTPDQAKKDIDRYRRVTKVVNKEEVVIEKTLSPAESKKKEEIVKSMKKDKDSLKARYGKRWKEVAYATATKSAKRVAEDQWSDIAGKESDWKPSKKTPSQAMSAARNLAGKAMQDAKKKKMKKEEVEQIVELSKKVLRDYMRANTKRMADPKNPDSMERKMKRHDDYFKASKKVNEAKGPTSDYGLETFSTNESPTTPLERAKSLAKSALSKIKSDLGKK